MPKTIRNIARYWYVYIVAIVAGVIGSIYYCEFINMPRKQETISLFVSSYSNDPTNLHKFLNEKKPDYLREINITMISPKSGDFDFFMVNKGLGKADIFILSESYLFEDLTNKQFANLNEEYLNTYFTYSTDESGKGILIHSAGSEDNDLMTFHNDKYDENFYLFYRKNSLHIGELGKKKWDTAIAFTKELLNYEKV